MANRYLLEITVATNTTIQAINDAVPNKGLDTPHPEEPTRKLLNAILRDYLQALESLENNTVAKSQIVQAFGDSQTAVISQDALTDYLSNLSFLQLADTPFVYAGSIGKFIRVNAAGDGLEFFELGAAAISNSFNDLSDKPDFDSIPQVVTAADFASLPATGDITKTYLTLDDGKLYYWSGSAYVVFTNDTATWAGIGGNIGDNAALTAALNDKADAEDAALKSTSIYAGAGLTGGGDLSADRTLNVDFGTGAGQVMTGDDSRVANLADGAYAQIGVDIAPLGQDGLVPPAHLPAQFSGDYDDLTNKPTLFSGAYDDLTGKPTLGTASALNVDTDADLAANSDALIPSQKAVKAYVDNNAGGVTLNPWTPATYTPIDLVTPWDFAGNGLTATLTGSTVSVTGNAESLSNGCISAAGVLSTTQTNNLYFKMGASAGFSYIGAIYLGFLQAPIETTTGSVQLVLSIDASESNYSLQGIGNGADGTEYSPPLVLSTSSVDSEFCISYMPIGGANDFGYATLYVDGEYVAQHDFTQAVTVDAVIVTPSANFPTADPANSAWVECLSNPAYPITGLPPLIIGAGGTKLDETAYPANATSNIFEITGTPSPLQWDAIGGTVVDGDLVAFDSAGVPFVVDVTARDYGTMAFVDDAASDGKTYARKDGAWVEANSDNLPEGTINKYNKPRTPLALTDDITINNPSNHGDLFVVPSTQETAIEIELLDSATSDYFYFTVLNKSNQAVTFSDGTSPIVDLAGFGSVTKGGLVTVLWDGNEWMISGGLD